MFKAHKSPGYEAKRKGCSLIIWLRSCNSNEINKSGLVSTLHAIVRLILFIAILDSLAYELFEHRFFVAKRGEGTCAILCCNIAEVQTKAGLVQTLG